MIDELKQWIQMLKKANKQKEYFQVFSETKKYIGLTLQTTTGKKTISSIEPEENNQLRIRYQDGNFSIIPDINSFKQIMQRMTNVDRR